MDNVGLRGPYALLTSFDSSASLLRRINQGTLRRVLVIMVNAMTEPPPHWDRQYAPPGVLDTLNFVTSKPINAYSLETIRRMRDAFKEQKEEDRLIQECARFVEATCPGGARVPLSLPLVDYFAVEVGFEAVAREDVRRCLHRIPTNFSLPEAQVSLLRRAAAHVLLESRDFREAMKAIAPLWSPAPADIDPGLLARACPPA